MTLNRSFFLLTLAFFGMCTLAAAVTVALSTEDPSPTANIVAFVAFGLIAAILWLEARRDLDAVPTLVAAFLGCTAMCVGIYVFVADSPGILPKVIAAASGATAVALGMAIYRRQRSESPDFPNVLAHHVVPAAIFETEGIQFTGLMEQGGSGKPHEVSIVLQNCFDAPRRVAIRFDAASSAKYLRFHPQYEVALAAAEVSRVSFPVVAPTYPGSYSLYFSIGVSGNGGKRVRLWRAQEATERVKTAATVALLAVGHLHVGGGIRFTIGPLPDDLWTMGLPVPHQESLWQPRIGTVPLVQTVS